MIPVMALIRCPECSNEVSDQASSCPKCGYPMPGGAEQRAVEPDAIVKEALLRGGKIAAIKLYREHNPGVGLADAKRYVERIEANLPPGAMPKSSQGCMSAVVLCGLIAAVTVAGVAVAQLVSWRR